jgi:hypothetical protein
MKRIREEQILSIFREGKLRVGFDVCSGGNTERWTSATR